MNVRLPHESLTGPELLLSSLKLKNNATFLIKFKKNKAGIVRKKQKAVIRRLKLLGEHVFA